MSKQSSLIAPLVLWAGLFFMGTSLPACQAASLTPRLPVYLGTSSDPTSRLVLDSLGKENISYPITVGLRVLSDDTSPGSAPALSNSLLEVLQNRMVQRIPNELPLLIQSVAPIGGSMLPGEDQSFFTSAQAHHVDFVILAVLSSIETESPTEIGEETMMTRMPGVEVANYALAEIALVDVHIGTVLFQVEGQASETMEQLSVPLGNAQDVTHDSYDILRANAGQKALDLALSRFIGKWQKRVATSQERKIRAVP